MAWHWNALYRVDQCLTVRLAFTKDGIITGTLYVFILGNKPFGEFKRQFYYHAPSSSGDLCLLFSECETNGTTTGNELASSAAFRATM